MTTGTDYRSTHQSVETHSNHTHPYFTPNRRQVLSALGAGSLIAVAGCLGAADEADTAQSTEEPTHLNETVDTIDPLFGYVGRSPDQEPPVEPDHEIQLLIKPREGGGEIPEFYFEPVGLHIETGETVQFTMTTPHHNVNAIHAAFGYQQRVPEDVPPFSSPVLAGGTYWLYTFDKEGVYDYVCSPHEAFGMAGRIVAGSAMGPGSEPIDMESTDEQARPPTLTAALVLSDEALDPERIVDEGSVSWDDLADESKQLLMEIRGAEGHASHESHE